MKLLVLFCLFAFSFGSFMARANTPVSTYANASLYLTSTNSQQLSSANSTSSVGFADADAQPGLMDNSIFTHGASGMSATSYENETVSGFSDQLTITDPSLTGSSGTLEFHFLVTGTEAFAAVTPSVSLLTVSASFTAPGASDNLFYSKDSSGNIVGTDFLGVPQTVVVPFVFGTPFTIDLTTDFTGLVEDLTGGGDATVSGTFSTTASTDNVKSLVSTLPNSSFTQKSASGATYFSIVSVPEPNGLLLAMAGLVALPFLKLRRFKR